MLYNHGGQNSIIADGVIVNKKQVLKDKDVIIIANAKLLFSSNGINYTIYDEGINLEVNEGEVVTVLGSSGSGKTTMLRCINFLEKADKGQLEIDGKIIDMPKAGKKETVPNGKELISAEEIRLR